MRLKNMKAFVTGASRGIGKEIVKKFLIEGADVWAVDVQESPFMDELASVAKEAGTKITWIQANITDEAAIDKAIEEGLAQSGGFDIVVNNAGITRDGLVFRMTKEDWEAVMNVNVTGTFLVSRACSRDMIKRRKGSIINISSVVGVHGNAGQCNYSSSKAALIGFTKSLAQEVGSRGVRVNAIAPGFIVSDMTDRLSEDVKKAYSEKIPLKRFGSAEDIANSVVFLASQDSTYITGHVLGVDGGMGM